LGREVGDRESGGKTAALPKGDTPCFLYVWQGKDLREGELYVWQRKELRVDFMDVWQAKELGSGASESINRGTLGIDAEVSARKWRGFRGNGRRATIMSEFTV